MKISEILKFDQPFPTSKLSPDEEQEHLFSVTMSTGTFIKQLSSDMSIFKRDNIYSLVQNDLVVGVIKVQPIEYFDTEYSEIELVYVTQKFRKSPAIRWMLYAVREITSKPLLIDGVVFTGGQKIINFVEKNKLFKLQLLDKTTGELLPYDPLVNDMDLAIVLESANIGFGKDYLPETTDYIWYNLEEYLGKIQKKS